MLVGLNEESTGLPRLLPLPPPLLLERAAALGGDAVADVTCSWDTFADLNILLLIHAALIGADSSAAAWRETSIPEYVSSRYIVESTSSTIEESSGDDVKQVTGWMAAVLPLLLLLLRPKFLTRLRLDDPPLSLDRLLLLSLSWCLWLPRNHILIDG